MSDSRFSPTTEELTVADYVAILRRRWLLVLAPIVVLLALGGAWSARQTDRFEATARVLLAPSTAGSAITDQVGNAASVDRANTNAALTAESDGFLAFIEATHGAAAAEADVAVNPETNSDVISFTASATDPQRASLAANAWASTFIDLRFTESMRSLTTARSDLEARTTALVAMERSAEEAGELDEADLLLIRSEINALTGWITQLDTYSLVVSDEAGRLIDTAQPPSSPINQPLSQTLVLAGIVGLIAGVGLALLRENLDQAVRSADDLDRLGVTLLGEIPKATRAEQADNLARWMTLRSTSPISAAYRQSVAMVRMEARLHDARSILVTSALANDGKTTSSTNLALGFAESGDIVALVDADLRRPSIAPAFAISPNSPGFSDAIRSNDAANELSAYQFRVGDGDLAVITAGSPISHPSVLLACDAVEEVVSLLETEADFTVFDGPPALLVSDALSFAPFAGAVVLAVKAGETRTVDLKESVRSIKATGATILGAILVGTPRRHHDDHPYEQATGDAAIDLREPAPSNVAEPVPMAHAP